ncbi:TIGR01459 family HAD-type hydrolase [Hyphococcus luteus]|uniref:TIGR01459 family HAD-type hydrolase n=1 Tax=Hyphococcus luteus TaxID=2058213 RepID=A0A2S7K8M7_9PROT|nr:TIGR01459 family HAD-type hydrolase [Marinicaulis flavus]PQA88841.1 TIGR01459 family HAD-type hydrolase [Marinicaulis flavus]
MSDVPVIQSLSEIAERYDALLCDAWGVIHDGVNLFPGAGEAMTRFRETRGPVVILTNAPRPSSIIPAQLDRLGLPRGAYDAVVTSGDATRAAIKAHLPEPALRIGPAMDDPLYEGLEIDFRPLEEAAFIICTGLNDEENEEPEAYRDLLGRAAERRLPMVCANPDIIVNWGGRMMWCAGAIGELYKDMGGEVIYGGKPHWPVYDLALKEIETKRGPTPRARILAVGDGLKTDILGANNHGFDALLIAGEGGVHEGDKDAAAVSAQLAKAGLKAAAVAGALQW